eukprot:gene883-1106_t
MKILNQHYGQSDNRKNQLVKEENILKYLLNQIEEEEEQDDHEQDQIFHWSLLLFKCLFDSDYFPQIYKSFAFLSNPAPKKNTNDIINDLYKETQNLNIMVDEDLTTEIPAKPTTSTSTTTTTTTTPVIVDDKVLGRSSELHITLLKLLDGLVANEKNVKDFIKEDSLINLECCSFLLNELSILYNLDFSRKNSASQSHLPTALNPNDFNAIYFLIKIFGNLTSYSDEMTKLAEQLQVIKLNSGKGTNNNNKDQLNIDKMKSNENDDLNTVLCKRGLAAICVGSLHGNVEFQDENTTIQKDKDSKDKGFKKELIRILGNLAYRNRDNQNEIRELGGIELVLNHARFDVKNPYIREWSLFAIRNLLEGNEENQKLIENLKMKGIANQEELEALGIQVTNSNGALKFKHDPSLKKQ